VAVRSGGAADLGDVRSVRVARFVRCVGRQVAVCRIARAVLNQPSSCHRPMARRWIPPRVLKMDFNVAIEDTWKSGYRGLRTEPQTKV